MVLFSLYQPTEPSIIDLPKIEDPIIQPTDVYEPPLLEPPSITDDNENGYTEEPPEDDTMPWVPPIQPPEPEEPPPSRPPIWDVTPVDPPAPKPPQPSLPPSIPPAPPGGYIFPPLPPPPQPEQPPAPEVPDAYRPPSRDKPLPPLPPPPDPDVEPPRGTKEWWEWYYAHGGTTSAIPPEPPPPTPPVMPPSAYPPQSEFPGDMPAYYYGDMPVQPTQPTYGQPPKSNNIMLYAVLGLAAVVLLKK